MDAPLNKRFCLQGERRNFAINFRLNHEDRAAYFGIRKINEEIIEGHTRAVHNGLSAQEISVWTIWCGKKTHTLFNIKYKLEEKSGGNGDHRL